MKWNMDYWHLIEENEFHTLLVLRTFTILKLDYISIMAFLQIYSTPIYVLQINPKFVTIFVMGFH